jgi:antibiotic biosynthesis monooxygenase (ABM) superfamily enzyme
LSTQPIQLHVDLEVDPAKEASLLKPYAEVFRPTISRQPGFAGVTLLKARKTGTWRLLISFATEEERLTWVASDDHQMAWPQMEANLTGIKFSAVLFDVQ